MSDITDILTAIKDTDGIKKITDTVNVAVTENPTGTAPSDSQTRPDDTTAYAALDVVGEDAAANLEFADVLATAGGAFVILSAKIRIDAAVIPAGMTGFRLHLYDAAPTAITDNVAYNLPSGDRAKYLGYISVTDIVDNGDTVWCQADAVNFVGKLAAASTTLYGVLQTIGAYTPSASTVKTITLNVAAI